MEQALIGILGLIVGIVLNEYFRRRNRIEAYSTKVFERRLEAYEGLMKAIRDAEGEVNEVLDDESLDAKERHEKTFEAGLRVMEYTDEHSLFLNDEIIVHCGAAFIGVDDILNMPNGKNRTEEIDRFRTMIGDAKKMIRVESGMSEIDQAFRSVTKAKHSSSVIDSYRKLKIEHERTNKRV